MPKGSFISDTFEQLAELGQSTVKKTGQAVKKTISPTKILGKIIGTDQDRTSEVKERNGRTSEVKKGTTPLDFQKLQKKYETQDAEKTNLLRNRLFQLVKSGEEQAVLKKRQEEKEKKQKLLFEEQEKKKKEEEKKKQQAAPLPLGKIRRSIFSPKKVAERSQAEVRPATGKQ